MSLAGGIKELLLIRMNYLFIDITDSLKEFPVALNSIIPRNSWSFVSFLEIISIYGRGRNNGSKWILIFSKKSWYCACIGTYFTNIVPLSIEKCAGLDKFKGSIKTTKLLHFLFDSPNYNWFHQLEYKKIKKNIQLEL